MKIHLDYARPATTSQPWVWGLVAASLVAVVAASWEYNRLQEARAGLQMRLEQANAQTKAPVAAPLPAAALTDLQEQAHQANLVLAELGRPWPGIFAQLEKSASREVALLAVRPDATKGRLRISGEACTLGDALDYVRQLAASGVLSDVVLEEHEVVDTDPEKPVRFALTARWEH